MNSPPKHPFVAWLRQFAGLWGFGLFIVLLVVLFRAVMLPFALGMLLAYVLAPLVRWLAGGTRRMPRWAALIAVYVILAGAIAGFSTAFLPHLSADFARLFRETPRFFGRVKRDWVPSADAWLDRNF